MAKDTEVSSREEKNEKETWRKLNEIEEEKG